jgi:hypothetical protein
MAGEPAAGSTFYGDAFAAGVNYNIPSPNTDWVVACGRNIGSTLSDSSVSTLINGVPTTVAQGGLGNCKLAINLGVREVENDGDWQLSRVYVWDLHLPDAVFAIASARLNEALTAPELPAPPPPKGTDPLADILKIYPAHLMASAESWNPSQQRFLDLSGNGRVGTLQAGTVNVGSVTGHGANLNWSVPYAEGTTGTQISWGAGSLPQNFTICSVTRHYDHVLKSRNLTVRIPGIKKRILQCADKLGYPITNGTDWVVACARNIGSTLSSVSVSTLINGVPTTVAQGGEGSCELAINLGNGVGNGGIEKSDWQLSRVYVWARRLPDAVFADASARLIEHLKAPEGPKKVLSLPALLVQKYKY